MNIIYFILILSVVIFIHELGHFLSAKKAGVHVFEFAIGMGPKIFKHKFLNDETEYTIRLLPLGGFVSMAGETEEEDKIPKEKQLVNKSWYVRFRTMIAGVIMNFILAILIFIIIGNFNGNFTNHLYVGHLEDNLPAKEVLVLNDKLLKINDKDILSYEHMQLELLVNKGKTTKFTILREGKVIEVSITPKSLENNNQKETYFGMSIVPKVEYGFFESIKGGLNKLLALFHQMFLTLGYLISGKISIKALSGPIGIYKVVEQSSQSGFMSLLFLTGYISLNVGFINILPFPAFDGGHILFLIIEYLKGSPVDRKLENLIHTAGFIFLILLMLYITFGDIINLIGR